MRRCAAVRTLAVAAFTLAASLAASAEEPAVCYGIMTLDSPAFSEPSLKVVSRDAPKKVVFAKNGYQQKGCPDAAACATPSYVVPGDPVIVGAKTGAYVCAIFVGRKPSSTMTQGWIAAASLSDPKAPAPRLADWVGAWRSGDEKQIAIKRAGDHLEIDAHATWGAGDPQRVANGGVNEGGFDATITPNGGAVAFSAAPTGETLPFNAENAFCRVRMWRFGPYLVAADNGGCGGANVTFSDVYRRD